jgi:hypothetical protein
LEAFGASLTLTVSDSKGVGAKEVELAVFLEPLTSLRGVVGHFAVEAY